MPKFNVDEVQQLSEPIEIVLDGVTYKLEKVSSDLMDKVTTMTQSEDKTNILPRQLGLLLGVAPELFNQTDVRKLGKVLEFITKEVVKGFETKNA